MKILVAALTAIILIPATLQAQDANVAEPPLAAVGMDKSEGCMAGPMIQFGRYIGDWNIADEQLSLDGKTWTPGPGARWNFVCVGNGTAIQDFWMPNGGGFGTNLRMYDKENDVWDIAWTNAQVPAMAHIGAKLDDGGNIVMHYIAPKPSPARRIIFFPPTKQGWNWKLEISTDGEKTWREVYRITATPR